MQGGGGPRPGYPLRGGACKDYSRWGVSFVQNTQVKAAFAQSIQGGCKYLLKLSIMGVARPCPVVNENVSPEFTEAFRRRDFTSAGLGHLENASSQGPGTSVDIPPFSGETKHLVEDKNRPSGFEERLGPYIA